MIFPPINHRCIQYLINPAIRFFEHNLKTCLKSYLPTEVIDYLKSITFSMSNCLKNIQNKVLLVTEFWYLFNR